MKKHILLYSLILIVLASCKNIEGMVTVEEDGKDLPFRKVLKHQDNNVKYKYAEKYFTNKEYTKAVELYEELVPAYVLTERAQHVYYRYAECQYFMKDYYLAGYYFKKFTRKYAISSKAEEALFMHALCKVKLSPNYSLDQTETENAIEALQLFVDRYPQTVKKDTCNLIMDKLNAKLELKQFEKAKLAYNTENYKAATVLFKTTLEKYPNTRYKEETMFLHLKSSLLLAENSIETKKKERFEETIKSYHIFVASFPDSENRKEAEKIKMDADRGLSLLKQIQVLKKK